jgi:hypothetical protein
MGSEEAAPQSFSIAVSFSNCYTEFRKFYIALINDGCSVAHQVSRSRINDEYGRLGVWGKNSGVDRIGRGSLDDALRNDPNLQSIVLDVLNNLHDDLERGIPF